MSAANHKSSGSCKAAPDQGRKQAPALQTLVSVGGESENKGKYP